jgi:hypothetical protein
MINAATETAMITAPNSESAMNLKASSAKKNVSNASHQNVFHPKLYRVRL